jgi:nucleoside phosphorylase
MQTKKILILLAVEEELGAENITALSATHTLRLMGVGKLRAYEATLRALREENYDVVINVGTCGSFRHPYATLLRPSVVAQGDIYLDSIFASKPVVLSTGDEGVSIVSSDNFIGEDTPAAQREKIAGFDCMDMESYAVVRAVRLHSSLEGKPAPKVYMLKAVSDGADGTIGDWSERVEALRPVLREALDNLIKEINDEN